MFHGFSKKNNRDLEKYMAVEEYTQIIDTCLKAKSVDQCESQTNRESQAIHGKSNISSSKSRLIPTLRGQKVAITIPRGKHEVLLLEAAQLCESQLNQISWRLASENVTD